MTMLRTHLYVDGFNLYHRIVRDTPYKWLNVQRLAELIVQNADIQWIGYYTARAKNRSGDPFMAARQEVYFRALRTLPNLEIYEGSFQSHPTRMPLAHPPSAGPKFAEVIRTEEKGSDVNLASHLLIHAFKGEFQQAIVISNDSDLATPIEYTVKELGLPVIVLCPPDRRSKRLRQVATSQLPIRQGPLSASQFPRQLLAENGRTITKPTRW